MKNKHFFSIIIPVRNVNDHLKENILHLKQLNYDDFEVIVLLDSPPKYAPDFQKIKLVYVPGNLGPAEKRNIGANKSIGDILVFLDDDAYPTKDWLINANQVFNRKEFSKHLFALGGPAMTPPNVNFKELCSGLIHECTITSNTEIYRHIPKSQRLINDYPTVNLFVKKQAFDEIGGFDTRFWPGEDTKLCLDLVNKFGTEFLYSPEPIVFHHRRQVFIPHLKQVSRYGMYRGRFAIIFPKTSRKFAYFVPSLFTLGLLFGGISFFISVYLFEIYVIVLCIYLLLLTVNSAQSVVKSKKVKTFFYVFIGIFLTHVTYGIYFILGLVKNPSLKLKKFNKVTGNYSEG